MHGLIFETSIWLLAGSTRFLAQVYYKNEWSRKNILAAHPFLHKTILQVYTNYTQQTVFATAWQQTTLPVRIAIQIAKFKLDKLASNNLLSRTDNEAHHDTITIKILSVRQIEPCLSAFRRQAPALAVCCAKRN